MGQAGEPQPGGQAAFLGGVHLDLQQPFQRGGHGQLFGAGLVQDVAYGYDLDDHLTSKTTTGTAGAGQNTYGYDDAGRLTSWTDPAGQQTEYGWDAAGNRTKAGPTTYTYDERNRLTSDGTHTYTYTARGTLTSDGTSTPVRSIITVRVIPMVGQQKSS
ncbi:RHS repeat domain-containing protein [Actinomadura sp. 3N508]|uniref:RHS repeat domain-containing protein n=1 Tax=Actinomadura sp. 3N508 TaxID=3375153 RepID=UPI00378F57C7